MKWLAYEILFHIGYGLMLPTFLPRLIKRGGFRAHFGERFGRYAPGTAARLREKPRVWIHAVSVGEAKLAGNLVAQLRKLNPADSYILSATSVTGRGVCEKFAAPDDVVIYFPLDFIPSVRRAMRTVNAKALILIEAEIWPNIIRRAHAKNIPLILACARISDSSAPRYRRLRFFLKDVFKCFTLILAQSRTDEERLVAAGADPALTTVTGSAKFDAPPPPADSAAKARLTLNAAGIDPDTDLVLLGGSTWPGEESALVRAWLMIRPAVAQQIKPVIVPRHAERGAEIEAELTALGVNVIRRSTFADLRALADKTGDSLPSVFLVDTTGELSSLYPHASLVFIGKSLPPNKGAQNMIEPAALGKPVIIGPDSQNFSSVMELFRNADAIKEVRNQDELTSAILHLAANKTERDALGARARRLVESQRGALEKTAETISEKIK